MIPKDDLIREIKIAAALGHVAREELLQAYDQGSQNEGLPAKAGPSESTVVKTGIAHAMYYLGGAVVFIGIAMLIGQHWRNLSYFTQLLATMGSAIVAYGLGVLLSSRRAYASVGNAFFFIAALTLPMGLGIGLHHAGFNTTDLGPQSTMAAILAAIFLISYMTLHTTVFELFSIIFSTWLFISFSGWLVHSDAWGGLVKFFEYRALIIGAAYLLLGYQSSRDGKQALTGPLYGFGVMIFLGAALALGGSKPHQNIVWEMIFPVLTLGAIVGSVYLKRKSLLTFGSLYLMGYICKITIEYFEDSMGWPLSLVLIGLLLIAVGYGSFQLHRKL